MKKLKSVSIHAKLMLIVMTTTFVALLVALVAMAYCDQLTVQSRMRRDAVVLAEIVAYNSTPALNSSDPLLAEDTLTALRANPHLGAVVIYDAERKPLARYVRRGWDPPIPLRWSGNLVFFAPKYLEVSQPVVAKGHPLGTVLLQTDLDELAERRYRSIEVSVAVLLVAIILGYILAAHLERFISGPIQKLLETTRAVAMNRNYGVRVRRETEDDLGRLVDGFNEMLSQIEKRDVELQLAQTELERRVAERTHDLFQTNARLQLEVTANVRAREDSDVLRSELQEAYENLQREAEERAAVQEALRRSEERFSKAFRANPVALAILTRGTRVFVDVNERFSELVGQPLDKVIGQTMFEPTLWTVPETRARIEQVLADGQAFRNWECRIACEGSDTKAALLSAVSFMLGGEPCVLLMTEDISERVNLEAQLRQSQKMEAIGQLASGVAHDFNNLLTIIQGHAEIVLASQNGGANSLVKQALQRVVSASQRAAQLTGQLLTFSRKQVAKPKPLDLNQVIGNVTSMLKPLLGEQVRLRWNATAGLPALDGDAAMLEQVIVNLAVNARDAMPRGGDLIINAFSCQIDSSYLQCRPQARPGHFICLQVTDSGCGMDQRTLERLFEPFFTTKGVGKGTGLGLATAYSIVKQHRGWIEVVSQVGMGSTFKIFLPVSRAPGAPAPADGDLSQVRGGEESILVVEDEPALRELVTELLRGFGYRVLEASHGKEALKVWQRAAKKPVMLLTDIMMPEGMTGWELAEKLRAEATELKVVFTSGYSPELFGRRVQLQEHSNFLAKPFHPHTLAKTVRQCLDDN